MSAASLAVPGRSGLARRRLAVILGALLLAATIAAGGLLWRLASPPSAAFVEQPLPGTIPVAIAIDHAGGVWFTLESSQSIGVLRAGAVTAVPRGSEALEPLGLGIASDNSVWFTDATSEAIGHLLPDGTVERAPLPTHITQFGRLAVAPDDGVWFADNWSNSVVRLRDGAFTPFPATAQSAGPYGVAVGADGTVWATLQQTNRLLRVATDGRATELDVPTRAAGPTDIAVDATGGVWFVELRAGRIGHFADGRFSEVALSNPAPGLTDIAVAPNGDVWFTELRDHKLGRLRDGAVTEFPLARPDARPVGVAVDPTGTVWYTDLSGWIGHLPSEQARSTPLELWRLVPWPRG
jgi:virginiamycin B lyase